MGRRPNALNRGKDREAASVYVDSALVSVVEARADRAVHKYYSSTSGHKMLGDRWRGLATGAVYPSMT